MIYGKYVSIQQIAKKGKAYFIWGNIILFIIHSILNSLFLVSKTLLSLGASENYPYENLL